MEFTGRVTGVTTDFLTGKHRITLEVNEASVIREGYDKIKGVEKLAVKITQYRKKRSLDANAYFHVLVGKIADELRISKARCKNILLSRYGQPELLDSGAQAVIKTNIPVSHMLEQETLHCFPCGSKVENGYELTFYKIYRGSHTYDTKEMSVLIDCTVQEAKDLGIDTVSPEEIRKMNERWGLSKDCGQS